MKLKDLFEEEGDMDATQGAGFPDKQKKEKRKLSSHFLRRKAEKSDSPGDAPMRPLGQKPVNNVGDDPDHKRLGAGLR